MAHAQRKQKPTQSRSTSTTPARKPPLLALIGDAQAYEQHLIAQLLLQGPAARHAADTLYRKYRSQVSRVASSFNDLNADEVEDVVQDTFVRAFRAIATLKETGRFAAWLLTIARNRALSELSSRGIRGKAAKDAEHETQLFADVLPTAPEQLEHNADLVVVRKAIDGLPEGAVKETIRLFYVEGTLSAREIGKKLGVGKSAITMRLERFRNQVREQILDRCEGLNRNATRALATP